jgi:hypothetical protein
VDFQRISKHKTPSGVNKFKQTEGAYIQSKKKMKERDKKEGGIKGRRKKQTHLSVFGP